MNAKAWAMTAAMSALLLTAAAVRADDTDITAGAPTFARDVAPIIYGRCAECHRPGELGPMSLMSYEEVRPWAKSIAKSVKNREMPPWDADPRYGDFINDISMSQDEIETIVRWVEMGAPAGDLASAPAAPEFTDGWKHGEPDYIAEFDEYTVPATGTDIFPNLSVQLDLPEDTWIQAIDFRPGNRKVTHHIVLFRGEGMNSNGGVSPDNTALAGWASGTPPLVFPEGMGHELKKKDKLTVNMHYHPYGEEATDRTRIGLYFGKGPIQKVISAGAPLSLALEIPPGEANYETRASVFIEEDIHVTSFFPHMHQRGKDMTFTLVYPDGRREIALSVPNYDFAWQWNYYPRTPTFLPKGSRVEVVAHHDNSASNPNNPDPSKTLRFGEESDDEMMIGAFSYYTDKGMRPKLPNLPAVADRFIAERGDTSNLYRVSTVVGLISVPAVIELPKDGMGVWSSALPGQMISLPSAPIKWDGDSFVFDIKIGRLGTITISGDVAADGAVKGVMKIINVAGPDGSRENQEVPFKGSRVGAKLETAAAKGSE